MRRKVSTLLDEELFRRVKLESVRQGKQISEIVGEALASYLAERGAVPAGLGVVRESWGALRADVGLIRRILTEEDGLLDA